MNNSYLARKRPPKAADLKKVKDWLVTHNGAHTAEQIAQGLGWTGHKGLYRVRRRVSELIRDPNTLVRKVGDAHDSTGARVMTVAWDGKDWEVTQTLNSTHVDRDLDTAIEGEALAFSGMRCKEGHCD